MMWASHTTRLPPEVFVNRRTLDILLPIAYAAAILIAVYVGNPEWVGIVAVVGALVLGAYFVAFRRSISKSDPAS